MNKKYELVVVVDAAASQAKKKSLTEKINKLVEMSGGKVESVEDFGTKELAYPIKKITSGTYTIYTLDQPATAAKLINEKLALEDDVLRHLLTVKEEFLHIKSTMGKKEIGPVMEKTTDSI